MSTNKVILKDQYQMMMDYTATYVPLWPSMLARAVEYSAEVGTLEFRRVEALGDLFPKVITPKDTEIKQIGVTQNTRLYKRYFYANQFTVSGLQDQVAMQEVANQVLDAHNQRFDQVVLYGDGTSPSNVLNNGLYYSSDSNYVLESSVTISGADPLIKFHESVINTIQDARDVAGQKALVFYGNETTLALNSLYASQPVSFRSVLQSVVPDVAILEIPRQVKPGSDEGWMVVNMDQMRLHHSTTPSIDDSGVNAEKKYSWMNFLMGSTMVEVTALGGIIRQPATWA